MNKTVEKVKTLSSDLFHFCCFGGASDGGNYGFPQNYLRTASAQVNLFEPFYDDVMQPICFDKFDVKTFVDIFPTLMLLYLMLFISFLATHCLTARYCAKYVHRERGKK